MAAQVIPNSHITVYNKYIDTTTRAEKYQRTVINNVVWQSQKAITRAQEQVAANSALVMIPFALGADYLKPKAWQAARSGKWTLQEGDVIVRGVVAQEITTEYTLTALRAVYDDVVMIVSVDAMDQGTPNVQHWEVGCR